MTTTEIIRFSKSSICKNIQKNFFKLK